MKLDKDRIRALWMEGKTYLEIARAVGTSRGSIAGAVGRYRKEDPDAWPHVIPRRPPLLTAPRPLDPDFDEALVRSLERLRAFPGVLPDERDENLYGRPAGKPAYMRGVA